jgi:hypothetical protein
MNATSMPAKVTVPLYLLVLLASAPGIRSTQTLVMAPVATVAKTMAGCLPTGDGYLRARVRGGLDVNIDWHDGQLRCEGGLRPQEIGGIRVAFAGTVPQNGRHIRMIFGIAVPADATRARNVPTNVTVILEDEEKLFSTAGEGKCTIDELSLQPPAETHGAWRRVVARGFCTVPVTTLSGSDALELDRFDFAGGLQHED